MSGTTGWASVITSSASKLPAVRADQHAVLEAERRHAGDQLDPGVLEQRRDPAPAGWLAEDRQRVRRSAVTMRSGAGSVIRSRIHFDISSASSKQRHRPADALGQGEDDLAAGAPLDPLEDAAEPLDVGTAAERACSGDRDLSPGAERQQQGVVEDVVGRRPCRTRWRSDQTSATESRRRLDPEALAEGRRGRSPAAPRRRTAGRRSGPPGGRSGSERSARSRVDRLRSRSGRGRPRGPRLRPPRLPP